MLVVVSLTEERAIYLALELDRSWTETVGYNSKVVDAPFERNALIESIFTRLLSDGANQRGGLQPPHFRQSETRV